MEISEVTDLQPRDSPQPNNTYRTVKPPDRCVISYNFEQNNSLNFTHNLLIGMFNDNTKKHNKHSAVSGDKNKNKLFSILPNPKKIVRLENKAISKVYDARVQLKKYADVVSPRKDGLNGENSNLIGQKMHLQNNQNNIEKHSQSDIDGQTTQNKQFRVQQLLKPKGFDEKYEREVSAHRKRGDVLKENVGKRFKEQSLLDDRVQKTELYEDEQDQNDQSKFQVKNVCGSKIEGKCKSMKNQYKMQSEYSQQNKQTDPRKQLRHNQLQFNQSLAYHQYSTTQQLQPVSQKASVQKISNPSQSKIPSRKEIQDQQLRQLEQIVRKQERLNFKYNYFKKTDTNKQFLPFNAHIDPYRHQPTKSIQRNNSSKNIANNKQSGSMTETNSYHSGKAENKQAKNRMNTYEANNRGVVKNGEDRIGGKQNYQIQKHSSNKAGIPSIHQINQLKGKQFSLNQLNKYNKNIVFPTSTINQTVPLKKVHQIKNSNLIIQAKANESEKHVIKGFKVGPTAALKQSTSFSMTKQSSDSKITQLNAQPNQEKIKDQQKQNNRMSDVTSRTVKLNNNRTNKSNQTLNHPQHNTSKTKHNEKLPIKPTVARTPNHKNYNFKNWKESQLQKAMKNSRDNKNRRQSQQSRNKKVSNSNKLSNMNPNRKQKSNEIDLDAEEQDRFGLLAHKNVTMSKNKKSKKSINRDSKKAKKDIKIGQIKEESEHTIKQISEDSHGLVEQNTSDDEDIHQIQQLIQQNGELSRIQSLQEQSQQPNNSNPHRKVCSSRAKVEQIEKQECTSIVPINTKRNSDLEDLLIATEQLPPQYKISESKKQKSIKQLNKIQSDGQDMELNLPMPDLVCPIKNTAHQNQTDYHEEQKDKIDEFIGQYRNKQEVSKTQDFFAHNLKELSKLTDLANLTNYQPIDKNIVHYTRAPILSFLYQMPNQFSNYNQPFIPSSHAHKLLSHLQQTKQIEIQAIDQAVNILLSIDQWIIERVFEPFEDKDKKIGIWLYCQGKWTLFLQNKDNNFRKLLHNATNKAINLLRMEMQLENVLRLISGVRIMKLKSSKKRVFNQLQFSLKKGHTLKAFTSKQSKWGQRLFTVNNVQFTKDGQNVLQIKEQNEKYWVKQAKFKEIFQHFLLICTRKSHFWTNKIIQNRPEHKTVITLSSQVPAHGSITLFYPSAAPSSLLLYKQLQSKVLKFMGKIEEKSNRNGNLYFEFRLHGNYCIFLQCPQSCNLAVQSTSQLQIGEPQYIQSHNLKNNQCEYVQLNAQTRRKNNWKQNQKTGERLSKLREKFIKMVVEK